MIQVSVVGLILSLGYASVGSAAVAAAQARPVIRIAHLYSTNEFFSPIVYMMEKFNNTRNRSILPDYDVVVQPLPYTAHSGQSAVRVVEALLADPPFHAITGPFPNIDCLATVDLTAQARILQVTRGENAEFTFRRERYPHVFRVTRSMDGIILSWMYLLLVNDWHSALSIWVESPTLDRANQIAQRYNVTNFAILAEDGEDWLVEAWQSNAVQFIRQHRMRVVMTYLPTISDMYRFVCRVHRSKLSGLQYFARGTYNPGWFNLYFPPSLGDCSVEEVRDAVSGYIQSLHPVLAPGTSAPQYFINVPTADGRNQSHLPLTCMPELLVNQFYLNGELLSRGFWDGALSDAQSAISYLGNGASDTDMVCATLLALHDVIYNKGVDQQRVAAREELAFQEILDSVSKVDFQGPAGDFRFYPNSGDPEVIYYMYFQYLPSYSNDSVVSVEALITFPEGPDQPPQLTYTSETFGRLFLWKDGSQGLGPKSHLDLFPACGDSFAELVWDRCEPCAVGKAYDILLDACRSCAAGDYQGESGSSECLTALPGQYVQNTTVPTAAVPCPVGHECPQVGTVSPQQCPPGSFARESGLPSCELCPRGRYQSERGSSECAPCEPVLAGSTTTDIASTSREQCVCPEGAFRPISGVACASCPTGMRCPEGSDMRNLNVDATISLSDAPHPLLEEGYMSLATAPLAVFLCIQESACPGGSPGSCAKHRDSTTVACGDCLDKTYEVGEKCRPCGDAQMLPIVLAGIAGVAVVAMATIVINLDMARASLASLMILIMVGMFFINLQALGLFHQMNIPWPEPAKSLLRISDFFNFDLSVLKASCILGVNPVRSFASRQLVPLLVIPVVFCSLLLKKLVADMLGKPSSHRIATATANSIGTFFSLFFISIVVSVVNPFLCYKHPEGNGESVMSAPSLLCFESQQHTLMVIISVVSFFLVPVPFFVLCSYAIVQYPRKILDGHNSSAFLHAFRFLFFRYSPKRYYFHGVLLTRSSLLCMIPAWFRGQPSTQILLMCCVLGAHTVGLAQLQPWRCSLCNPLDAATNVMLSVILTCAALFLDDALQRNTIAALAMVAIVLLMLFVALGFLVGLRRRFLPSPLFDFFICHHKAHAAAQARFLKIRLLNRKPGVQVFVDSDDLKELDTLFDTVRSRLRQLIVYLTADTLRRPWCAGEVVSAVRAGVGIIRLQTPAFVCPSYDELASPESYVDPGCNLIEYGILWRDVTQAYELFFSNAPRIDLNVTAIGTRRFDHAAGALLQQRNAAAEEDVPTPLKQVPLGSILIASLPGSDEASATAGILSTGIASDVWEGCPEGLFPLADYVPEPAFLRKLVAKAPAVVVILSSGCMGSSAFLTVICELQLRDRTSVGSGPGIPVNTPDFIFPSEDVYERIEEDSELLQLYGGGASDLVRSFFKTISVFFPTHASQQAIDIQATEVVRRIRAHRNNSSKSGAVTSMMAASLSMSSRGTKATPSEASGSRAGSNSPRQGSTSPRSHPLGQHPSDPASPRAVSHMPSAVSGGGIGFGSIPSDQLTANHVPSAASGGGFGSIRSDQGTARFNHTTSTGTSLDLGRARLNHGALAVNGPGPGVGRMASAGESIPEAAVPTPSPDRPTPSEEPAHADALGLQVGHVTSMYSVGTLTSEPFEMDETLDV